MAKKKTKDDGCGAFKADPYGACSPAVAEQLRAADAARARGKATYKRKVIQLAVTDNHVYALCDDGTIWNWNHEGEWKEWPPTSEIPGNTRPPEQRPAPLRPSSGGM